MTIKLLISTAILLLLNACTTTTYTARYHHFTNEFDVVGQVELTDLEVYHQMDLNFLSIKVINLTNNSYFFHKQKTKVYINEDIIYLADNEEIAILKNKVVSEIKIPLALILKEGGISLKDTSNEINIRTELLFSDFSKKNYFTNSYRLKRTDVNRVVDPKEGSNSMVEIVSQKRLDLGKTLANSTMGIVTFLAIAATIPE